MTYESYSARWSDLAVRIKDTAEQMASMAILKTTRVQERRFLALVKKQSTLVERQAELTRRFQAQLEANLG
jgi:hypothetical protein